MICDFAECCCPITVGGGTTISSRGTELVHNIDEWVAFAQGVAAGEFDRA